VTRVTLTLHEAAAEAMRSAAALTNEIAGVLIVGKIDGPDELRLLAREFHPAPPEAYLEQSPRHLRLSPAAYMAALSRADTLHSSALFVHSHPQDEPVTSPNDDVVDQKLRRPFQIRTGSPLYGSIVLQVSAEGFSFSGRVWRGDQPIGPISMIRELGKHFHFTSSIDAAEPLPPPAIFNRQMLAFGTAMQALLSRLHIGVVGCGGTGSAVIEQLIRLGVGHLTAVDDQDLTDTNVTRVYGSGLADEHRPKVEIARDNATRIGLGTTVTTIRGSVTAKAVAQALTGCDLVFGCTDDNAGRLVLAQLAYRLLIPVLDVGTRIVPGEDRLAEVVCRLNVQVPGTGCVQCWGTIDPARVRAELMAREDLEVMQRDGYAPDIDTPDPAVVAYTTLVASLAVAEMLARLTGLTPGAPDRVMFVASRRQLSSAGPRIAEGHWCGRADVWGIGVTKRFLDMTWPKP
jgi:hypothetical protein